MAQGISAPVIAPLFNLSELVVKLRCRSQSKLDRNAEKVRSDRCFRSGPIRYLTFLGVGWAYTGQGEAKTGSLTDSAFHRDVASVSLVRLLHDGYILFVAVVFISVPIVAVMFSGAK